ncbi:tyrosine-type recombinase/integrase [Paramaledivibacter caminithermalis]|uniref:Integrase/recombinase XerD n=1 Tax=Paramaledivibacter caminithermalis (strain DSM 15212 / CIP 107654 / DViRD3) TaxID=1121301 RepID=A0A1M6PE79_PARC5|nr:tyrosine-type recombinase/integrase [Paramaledivibacter caminithermalis]SHK06221.1 integrase/recombinase XerD [Paramaledivibacter caminithermalis DSM 15212]
MYLEYQDFLFNCESRGLSPKTIKSYRNTILQFLKYIEREFGIKELNEIKSIHIKKYFKSKSDDGCTFVYINSIHKVLKTFFQYCYEEEYILTNPIKKVKFHKEKKRIIETFNDKEVSKLIDVYDFSNYLNVRNKAILSLQFDTGIRTTETINILNHHIQEGRIFILGKGNKERYVPVSIELKKILKRYEKIKKMYFKDKNIPDNYFLSRTGRPLTVEAIERIYKKAGEIAGIRNVIRCSPHTARHYYAIKMLENNDIYTVSKLLGHSKINITQIYLSSLTNEKIIERGQVSSPLSVLGGVGK